VRSCGARRAGAFRGGESIKHQVLRAEGLTAEQRRLAVSDPKPSAPRYGEVEHYAQGEIRSYHGLVNKWLLVVYAILAVWGVYYLYQVLGRARARPGASSVGAAHASRTHPDPLALLNLLAS
jgi:hypothetical protein